MVLMITLVLFLFEDFTIIRIEFTTIITIIIVFQVIIKIRENFK